MTHSSLLFAIALLTAPAVDFDTDVMPVLTKYGCNAGSCHGAATGRGGFKMSLFAGDPASDHRAIARDMEGRRVNLADPSKSLLLKKPAGMVDHEGGQLFDIDSSDANQIANWISQGALRHGNRKIVRLRVEPADIVATNLSLLTEIKVFADFADGEQRDVTSFAIFTPSDPVAIHIESVGKVKAQRAGWHTIAVRFLNQLSTVQVTALASQSSVNVAHYPCNNWIDEHVNKRLQDLGYAVAARAEDGVLLRRLQLDLTGRLPNESERTSYLAANSADKFDQRVEQLLSSEEFVDYWTYRLASWLHLPNYAVRGDPQGARQYHAWLRQQLGGEVGWDRIAQQLLTSLGDSHLVGPANFHRQSTDARAEAELVAVVFLGAELRCANCHNHPLDRWTQDDYHGLAAVFARVDRHELVSLKSRGEITNPATGSAIAPRLPGGGQADGADPRISFATWLTRNDNPYFAKAFVNRIWKELMGRGLVEPTDAIRSTNPATHPQLLDQLAEEFVANHFQLKPIIRQITRSAAYQRGSHAASADTSDPRFYAQSSIRSLTPEVYVDVVNDFLFDATNPNARAERVVKRHDALAENPALAALSGCRMGQNCMQAESIANDLATRLELMNGRFLNEKLAAPDHFVAKLIDNGAANDEIVRQCYLRAYGRLPNDEESAYWLRELNSESSERREMLDDFVWSLLNSQEFKTNH